MPFSDILGQERACSFLKAVRARDKMPHAYLFTGIPGVGKKSTAQALAMALNCSSQRDGDACGKCPSCRRILTANAPDFHVIVPERGRIGIDRIRELNHELIFASLTAKYRIFVICHAENMTPEAANAFLKSLEEPSLGTIFVLTASEPLDLLPTIVSRCQRVSFRPLPPKVVSRLLVEKAGLSEKEADTLADLSQGSMGRAWDMFETGFLEQREVWLRRIAELPGLSRTRALGQAFSWAEELKGGGSEGDQGGGWGPASVFDIWKCWYRDLLLAKAAAGDVSVLNRDFSQNLKKTSRGFSIKNLVKSFFLIDRASRDLLENRNAALVMENLVVQLRNLSGSSSHSFSN
jgi:DNA polymerase-3 subunit delta'